MKRISLLVLAIPLYASCVGDEPQVQPSGGGVDASSPNSDAGADAALDVVSDSTTPLEAAPDTASPRRCDPNKAFDAPTLATGVNQLGTNDYDARLSPDELTIYFGSDRNADRLYVATRASTSQSFGAPAVVNINATRPSNPTVSGDQLMLVLQENPIGIPVNISVSTRQSLVATWDPPTAIANVTNPGGTLSPYLLADKSFLYYVQESGGGAIKQSQVVAGQFQPGSDVAGIASANNDGSPVVTPDNLTIFWSSSRSDGSPKGGSDIWVAHRSKIADSFSGVTNAAELNTPATESPSWISPDGCVLYLTSGRAAVAGVDAAGGEEHIWIAKRPL